MQGGGEGWEPGPRCSTSSSRRPQSQQHRLWSQTDKPKPGPATFNHIAPLSPSLPLCKMGLLAHSSWEGSDQEEKSQYTGKHQTVPLWQQQTQHPTRGP